VDESTVLEIVGSALTLAAKLAGPMLMVSLVLGVFVSLIQTVTQIQEATLTFVPKLIGAALILMFAGGWMMTELTTWVEDLWIRIPEFL
jgi:flagellar biosynthesis protein FliQ